MTIYFCISERYICKKLSEPLESEHICQLYTDFDSFYSAILNMKCPPDLLILDYATFNHHIFNVYRYMEQINKLVPLIFYNDPCAKTKQDRINQWKMIFSTYYEKLQIDLDAYSTIFSCIAETVESEELRPYIPLLQEPRPIPQKYQKKKNNAGEQTKIFKEILPTSLFNLFMIFYKNKERYLELSELQFLLKTQGLETKKSSVYSSISRLREYLTHSLQTDAHLAKTKQGYRLIVV